MEKVEEGLRRKEKEESGETNWGGRGALGQSTGCVNGGEHLVAGAAIYVVPGKRNIDLNMLRRRKCQFRMIDWSLE